VADAPAQIEDTEAAMLTVGEALTVITFVIVSEHPLALVPATEYVVVAVGLTVILADVAPLLHK
jgi:hypothetical protein